MAKYRTAQFKTQWYKNGPDDQKFSNATVDLKRPIRDDIKKYTVEQKAQMRKWIIDTEKKFQAFKSEILKACE